MCPGFLDGCSASPPRRGPTRFRLWRKMRLRLCLNAGVSGTSCGVGRVEGRKGVGLGRRSLQGEPANQRMKLTGAAILVSRDIKNLQAAPAAYPYRSIPCRQRGIRGWTGLRRVGHPSPNHGDRAMIAASTGTLYVALELGQDKWLLACATQAAEKPRYRTLPARNLGRLADEIARAKERFRLPAAAPVCTCYEAGRDGFWLHRALLHRGLANLGVDSSSIEVDRRRKRVKSDPVDAAKLLSLLCRYHAGEHKVWRVVRVPTVADEDRRQLHRSLKDLQRQQTECSNRIQGLLASYGLTA